MIVEQIWTGNSYRNFNYLIVCPETGDALAIDPLDHEKCLNLAKKNNWEITKILNTHEHADHTGGNSAIVKATGSQVLAHENAKGKIPHMSEGVNAGKVIKVGKTVELECLDTPGHTMSHICILSHTEIPALFSGDTLFNAGAGNCHNGGHPQSMYKSFSNQLEKLKENTLIYPGHDYLNNNLLFTLDREPNNKIAKKILQEYENQDPDHALITTLSMEKEINTFFRLQSSEVIENLLQIFPEIGDSPSQETVFLKLRELRNHW